VAAQRRIPSIALAHHADDQLELFFLRLLRGSGGEGLAGMKWCSPSPHNGKIELVRPLLDSSKDALRDYARAHGIRYREDASNACRDFQRNRVRHELIPLLKKSYQPALDKVISRAMEVTGAEAAVVSKLALGWLERDSDHGGGSPALLWSERFEKLPVAIQRRCIQFQLIRHGIALEFDLVEALRLRLGCAMNVGQRSTSTKGQVGRVTPCAPLGGGETASGAHGVTRPTLRPETGKMPDLRVRLDATGLVHLESLESAEFLSGLAGFSLKGKAGDSSFDGISIEWRLISSHGGLPKKHTPGQEVFDADRIGPRVILRHWRPGDRFQPIGMDSAIKLQDFFTNEKISRQRRRELVLAVTGNDEVFWVEGLRISERFKLTKATKRSLQWAWRRVNCDACGHA
jgi:tRNA(Ile)-lysidine synthase